MSDLDDIADEAPGDSPSDKEPAAYGDPKAFELRGSPPRVMRLSRKALVVVGVAAGIGIGGSLLYALRPVHEGPPTNLYNTDSRNRADVVTAAPADYSKVPKLGPPLPGDLGRPILSAQAAGKDIDALPMGTAGTTAPNDPHVAAAEQARQRRLQERDAARASQVFLASGAGGSMPASADPAAQAETAPAPNSRQPVSEATSPPAAGSQAEKRSFLASDERKETASAERLNTPASAYILQAGSIIPAALITGIRSDLPGQITAQVTQDVYDSPTGRILLIPQGSRLIGDYDSQISSGQNRVLLAWDRLILPGGRSLLLDRQPGADASGMAGLQDQTDYHWGNMIKAALVSTLLGVGTELATDNDNDLIQALRYGTQDTVNQTGRQLVQRGINVPPTLTIRPGYPLRVIVTKDLVLEPIGEGDGG
jgi:type IV secretory pathway VirB10-like protein